jgi:hypothetical protein
LLPGRQRGPGTPEERVRVEVPRDSPEAYRAEHRQHSCRTHARCR